MPYRLQRAGEDLDWSFDWSDYLDDQGSPSDTISASTWLITPDAGSPSPTLHDDATSGAVTSTFLRDLTRGEVYVLENIITTAAGRAGRKRITIRCE